MRVSNSAMTPAEFRRLAVRISKYVDFTGCTTEKCIEKRILAKHSPKLDNLVDHGFARRLMLEKWLNPHPDYKEILGLSDDDYESLVIDAKEASERYNS